MIVFRTYERYIFLRVFWTIFAVLAVCLALIFMVDFVEHLRKAGKYSKEGGTAIWIVAYMAACNLPLISEKVLPFAVLIGSTAGFLFLGRSSELVILRSVGISAWQFIRPALVLALIIGIFSITLYNPLAAHLKTEHDRLVSLHFKSRSATLGTWLSGYWLRQQGVDGQSVLFARYSADQGALLRQVIILVYSKEKSFLERVEAQTARLKQGYWELEEAVVTAPNREPAHYNRYLISTHLLKSDIAESLASEESISFWRLPKLIEITEKAGLPSTRFAVKYQSLLAQPLLMCIMVLIAASVSLSVFRYGNIGRMVVAGLGMGFGFFIFGEISRKIGGAGLVSPEISAWGPSLFALMFSLWLLFRREDG